MTRFDGDLVAGSDSTADPAGRIGELVNTVEGRFTDPAQDFKRVDLPRVTDPDYIEADDGEIVEDPRPAAATILRSRSTHCPARS